MVNNIIKYIALGIICSMVCIFKFYSGGAEVQAKEQTLQTDILAEEMGILKNNFPNENGIIIRDQSNDHRLISPTAKYYIDLENKMVTGVIFTDVEPVGDSVKISANQAQQIAEQFANTHFSQFDTTNCMNKMGDDSCYVVEDGSIHDYTNAVTQGIYLD